MKINNIKNINFNSCNYLQSPQKEKTSSFQQISNPSLKSIYSKGMGQISFGAFVPKAGLSFFEKEINEQSAVVSKLINKYFSKPNTISNIDLNITKKELNKIKRINIVASGSSKNAADMTSSFIESVTKIPVSVHSASEFLYSSKPLSSKEDLMIFISQSGNTADTLNSLLKTNKKGLKSIALTNNLESKINNASNANVFIDAGEEKAVAATKTVTSSIFNLYAIGLKLSEIKGSLTPVSINKHIESLKKIPSQIDFLLKNDKDVKKVASSIFNKKDLYFYAKGPNIGAAKEGALKLTETNNLRIIADSSSEALHGTFASIKPENPVLQIIAGDKNSSSYQFAKQNIEEICRKRNVLNPIIMGPSEFKNFSSQSLFLELPPCKEEFSPLLSTIKFQQLTNSISKLRKVDPDNGGGFLTKFRQNMSL